MLRTVALLLLCVLGVDWWLPLDASLGMGLTIAASALFVIWATLLLRYRQHSQLYSSEGSKSERAPWLRVVLAALAAAFVVAKWVVVLEAPDSDHDLAPTSRSYSVALAMVTALGTISASLRLARFFATVGEHPARLMAMSFGSVGLLGSMLLSLPISLNSVAKLSLVDSIFMAFSAVCVTGLAVTNVAENYTLFGQVVLWALVQVGGLGIMVLSAAIAILAGQRLRVRSSAVLTEIVDGASLANLKRTILMICAYTLVLQGLGAGLLYLQFAGRSEMESFVSGPIAGAGSALWAAIFHATNAYCNAGFSNFHAGIVPFASEPGVLAVMTVLISLGGIGFPVVDELCGAAFKKLRGQRLPELSLHSRVALGVSGLLLVGVALAYLGLEWTGAFSHLSVVDKISSALFQSAAARTAGFNAVDIAALLPATLILTCAAMFIGAGPGSTGGGIKVTTFAVLIAGLRAELQSRTPVLLNRALPDAVIRKALGVVFLSILIVATAFFLLVLLEPLPPFELLFEVVSAFSTTGLSTGVTPKLSAPGKLLVTLLMFVGRIGPLTLALALTVKPEQHALRLPSERVLIG